MREYESMDWLYQEYWMEELSIRKISALCGVDFNVISRWMEWFNIPRRSHSEATKLCYKHGIFKRSWKPEEIATLRKMYAFTPTSELGGILGRNENSIRKKASQLKIRAHPLFHNLPYSMNKIDKSFYKHLSETDKAYLAAFLDGEGNISFRAKDNYSPVIAIRFYNTHHETMRWIGRKLRRTPRICNRSNMVANPHFSPLYAVSVCGVIKTKHLLDALFPYLKIKRRDALKVLKSINNILDVLKIRRMENMDNNVCQSF